MTRARLLSSVALLAGLAVATGASAGARGAQVAHPAFACPNPIYIEPATGVDDGCLRAQAHGTGYRPTLYTDGAQSGSPFPASAIPWFNAPGVSYPTGRDNTLPITNITSALPGVGTQCVWARDNNNNQMRYVACSPYTVGGNQAPADLDIENFDFTDGLDLTTGNPVAGDCTYIIVSLGTANTNFTFKNNKIKRGPNCYNYPLVKVTGTGNSIRNVLYNTMDGSFGQLTIADSQYSYSDGYTGGVEYFEYNHCYNQPSQCPVTGGITGAVVRYNWQENQGMGGGSWFGTATLAGDLQTLTLTGLSQGNWPVAGQYFFNSGSAGINPLGEIDSCTAPGVNMVCVLHTPAPGGTVLASTVNTNGAHNTYVFWVNGVTPFAFEDYEFNTGLTSNGVNSSSGTSNFELNGTIGNQVLQKAVLADNVMIVNYPANPAVGPVKNALEEALMHVSLEAVNNLTVVHNFVLPNGGEYCMHLVGNNTIQGAIDNGSGSGSGGVAGDVLTINGVSTWTDSSQNPHNNNIFQAGRLVAGVGGVPATEGGLPTVWVIMPFLTVDGNGFHSNGTGDTTGQALPQTYILMDETTGTPTPVSAHISLVNAQIATAIGTIDSSGNISGVNISGNVNMYDGSAMTAAGSNLDKGTCTASTSQPVS